MLCRGRVDSSIYSLLFLLFIPFTFFFVYTRCCWSSTTMALLASKSQYVHGGSHLHAAPPTSSALSQASPTNSEFSDGTGVLDDIR